MSSDIAETLVDVEAMVTAAAAAVAVVAAVAVMIAAASVWQGLSCGCWLLCVEAPGGGPPLGRHFGKSRFKSAFSKIRLVIATARSCLAAGCPFYYGGKIRCVKPEKLLSTVLYFKKFSTGSTSPFFFFNVSPISTRVCSPICPSIM